MDRHDSDARHLVIMGVSGSGKTTLALRLSEELGLPYAEADDFHPEANIRKMSEGSPLNDDDRWPWLARIRDWMSDHAQAGRGSIVTCSALKRSYRDLLRTAKGHVLFLHVSAAPAVLRERMEHRSGHFMPASLLPSQLATLEELKPDEDGVVLENAGTEEELVAAAKEWLDRHP